jgi:hypothetical protein
MQRLTSWAQGCAERSERLVSNAYCTAYERSASGADTLQRADTKSAQLQEAGLRCSNALETQSSVYN